METERVTASATIEAAAEAVFAVLADPSAHADIEKDDRHGPAVTWGHDVTAGHGDPSTWYEQTTLTDRAATDYCDRSG